MLRSMISATNTMNHLQKQIDTIGHNLANIDTQGYKRTETSFSELVRQQFNQQKDPKLEEGRLTPHGIRMGVGAKIGSSLVFSQGSLKNTGRALDIAFTVPNQFLQINVNGETQYTRDGALYLSPTDDGRSMLVTADGSQVLDENQNPIILEDNFKEIQIRNDGRIIALPINEQDPEQEFELGVVQVNNPDMLTLNGNNRYSIKEVEGLQLNNVLTFLDGALRNDVSISQGSLEMSNVDLSKEMSDLLISQRSYQMNAKSISLGDQMMGLINGVR